MPQHIALLLHAEHPEETASLYRKPTFWEKYFIAVKLTVQQAKP